MSRQDSPAYGWPAPRQSIIGTFCKCVAAVAITGILCGTGVVISTTRIAHGQIGNILNFANKAIEDLPTALQEGPSILADAINDRREPAYVKKIDMHTEQIEENGRTGPRTVIEIKNTGDEVVSVLALRAIHLDDRGRPMAERVVYGATPIAVEDEWRGPLFPGATRKIVVRSPRDANKVELEIAELRVWDKDAAKNRADDADDEDGKDRAADANRPHAHMKLAVR